MSDLSNLLGSVYGDGNADAAPVRHEPPADDRGPAWDDDARLDEAFQHWTPGPGPDAPAHEREMVGGAADTYRVDAVADPDKDLAEALSAALAAETRPPAQAQQPASHVPPPAPTPPVAAMPPVAPQPTMATPHHQPAPPPAPTMPAMPKEQAFAAPAPAMAPSMVAPMAAPAAPWQFGDDDIFPRGRKGKKG